MTTSCPTDCKEDRERMGADIKSLYAMSIPTWARAVIIALLGVLFAAYAAAWAYTAKEYATKTELAEVRGDVKEMRDAQQESLSILRRLDRR